MNKITIYQADDNDPNDKFENVISALLDFFSLDSEAVHDDDFDFDFEAAIKLLGKYIQYHASTSIDYLMETSHNFYEIKEKFKGMPLYDIYIIDIVWQDKGSSIGVGGFELIDILLQRNVLPSNILILSQFSDMSSSKYSESRLPEERKEYHPLFLSVQGLEDSLEYHLPKALKKSASHYFKKMTVGQIRKIKDKIKDKTNEEILEIDTKIGENDEYHFFLKDLLVGWRDNKIGKIENAQTIIEDLIIENLVVENQKKYCFAGHWREGKPYEKYWKEYLEIRKDENSKTGYTYEQEVNLHAFNYVLEFVSQFESNSTFELLQEKSPIREIYHIYATKTMKKKYGLMRELNWRNFKYKLIARRLLISQECLESIVNSIQTKYDDIELFETLLYYSAYNRYKEYGIRDIYNTQLGFGLDEGRNPDNPKKILLEALDGERRVLPDEEIWMNDFIPMVQKFYDLIDKLNKYGYKLKSFDDIVSLKNSENSTQLLEVWEECIGDTEFTTNTNILNIFQ